jgi:ubiquinone/menaquinone biosynthesis C-methylase UbiE
VTERAGAVPAARYDELAEWYDAWVVDVESDPLFAPVAALMGDVAGARVCELACGQGRVSRYLAGRGARVVGVDLSGKLLAIAAERERAEPRGVAYLLDDAHHLASVRDAAFDGVVCHMALMDIPDLASTLRAVARVLRPGGWFAFTTFHPCFNAPASTEEVDAEGKLWRRVTDYWTEGFWRSALRKGPPATVGAYHRTLGTYLNALTASGFVIEHVDEPRATGGMAASRPIWAEVPATLVARCRRRA